MTEYAEVVDIAEIKKLTTQLRRAISSRFPHKKTRTIGYPSGNFDKSVQFLSKIGSNIFWWASGTTDDQTKLINYFGHGDPNGSDVLNIEVQFNFPISSFSRRHGGAFLRNNKNGAAALAHRGIITLGHGRVPKATLFNEMSTYIVEALTGNRTRRFLLIGELNSPNLVKNIEAFSAELRSTAKSIRGEAEPAGSQEGIRPSPASDPSINNERSEYEAEEGYMQDRTFKFRTRNVHLIGKCKRRDNYTCQACLFRVQVNDLYIIDCHHKYPLSASDDARITNVNDLICLCPNCHRIAHTSKPPLDVLKIRKITNTQRKLNT